MEENLYEAMFLVDVAKGGEEFPGAIRHISDLLQRADAQVERIEKWAENKLAYVIKRVDRGIYVLVYFRVLPDRIAELRRDINLSEEILRVLILSALQVPEAKGEVYTVEGEVVPKPVEPVQEPESQTAAVAEPEKSEAENSNQSDNKAIG